MAADDASSDNSSIGDADEEDRYAAMVEFLRTFPTLSSPPTDLADLNDGVGLFEALGEIAPSHFDPTTIAHNLGENWALKSSNLRKLLRNLETYYHEELHKTADFPDTSTVVPAISRHSDREAIASLFELVAAAAVTCENRHEFVGRIMNMGEESQVQMKGILEGSLARLEDYDVEDGNDDGEGEGEEEGELVFDDSSSGLFGGGGGSVALSQDVSVELEKSMKEQADLRQQLEESRHELEAYKHEGAEGRRELEMENSKWRDVASDLQARLEQAQTSLTETETELAKSKRQLGEATAVAEELREKNALLADDLDVSNAKVAQLRKAEATAVAYRKKLESVGVMSQQMQELEDQSAQYLRQILDLETANKQIPSLQKRVEKMQEQMGVMEQQLVDRNGELKRKNHEVVQLKNEVAAAVSAKRMYEEELSELQAEQENGVGSSFGGDEDLMNLSLTSAKSMKESREKVIRLEHENELLKKQLSQVQHDSATVRGPAAGDKSHQQQISKLQHQLKEKDAMLAKTNNDKAKLEAYTKKTLAKFQQKYMVALQECKFKLKEKHDKIEQLEAEKEQANAAKQKEVQFLSSALYEVGLAVMQNNLTPK